MKTHNFNINPKIMNTTFNYTQSAKKFGAITTLILALLVSVGIQAQTATTAAATDTGIVKDAGAGASVKVIDNKGTVKYLQTNNGITSITSTAGGSKTTTTWQLGGTLTNNTYIDVEGRVFSLDGLKLETGDAATTATTQTGHDAGTTTTLSADTGWTLVVRDEASGELKKLLVSDLIKGIRHNHSQGADATADVAITVNGIPAIASGDFLTTAAKLFVYRNGAKLRIGDDFTVTANTVTIKYDATDLPMYTDDIVEIQYIK